MFFYSNFVPFSGRTPKTPDGTGYPLNLDFPHLSRNRALFLVKVSVFYMNMFFYSNFVPFSGRTPKNSMEQDTP